MSDNAPSWMHRRDGDAGILRTELPPGPASAVSARQAIRDALAAWAIEDPQREAELLASEVVTNAIEHAPGAPIGFARPLDSGSGGRRGVTCEVTDSSPSLPKVRQAGPDQEHGRGMAIVRALAAASGVRLGPADKTTWFTLAVHDRINRIAHQAELDPEAGA